MPFRHIHIDIFSVFRAYHFIYLYMLFQQNADYLSHIHSAPLSRTTKHKKPHHQTEADGNGFYLRPYDMTTVAATIQPSGMRRALYITKQTIEKIGRNRTINELLLHACGCLVNSPFQDILVCSGLSVLIPSICG